MFIARQLQDKNRAEYLLYMWQVEDILRAHQCDIDLPADRRAEQEEWYAHLCNMMREEGKMEHGHLQINRNVIEGLAEVHHLLIGSTKYPFYREMYYKVLPYLVELRSKKPSTSTASHGVAEELELCFELLYGLMLLRLRRKPISPETEAAAKDVSTFLGQLSDYYKTYKAGDLTLD